MDKHIRRNITVSLDQGFIERMDAKRGVMPRSRWLELMAEPQAGTPVVDRSPEPWDEPEESREPVARSPLIMTARELEEKRQAEAGEV